MPVEFGISRVAGLEGAWDRKTGCCITLESFQQRILEHLLAALRADWPQGFSYATATGRDTSVALQKRPAFLRI